MPGYGPYGTCACGGGMEGGGGRKGGEHVK